MDINISEFVTMKLNEKGEIMKAMTADELERFAGRLFAEADRLAKSGRKNNSDDDFRLAKKYENSASWAHSMMAQKRYG